MHSSAEWEAPIRLVAVVAVEALLLLLTVPFLLSLVAVAATGVRGLGMIGITFILDVMLPCYRRLGTLVPQILLVATTDKVLLLQEQQVKEAKGSLISSRTQQGSLMEYCIRAASAVVQTSAEVEGIQEAVDFLMQREEAMLVAEALSVALDCQIVKTI